MGTVIIGSTAYDIYDDLDGANDYLDVHLGAVAWNAGDSDFQSKVLVMASRLFNRLKWKGDVTDAVTPQPLAWPRDSTGVLGHVDGTTPDAILNGFWEMAALIGEDPDVINSLSSGSNVQRAKAGEAEVWFFRSTLETAPKLPTSVHEWIKDYLLGEDGVLAVDYGTYTEEFSSVFDDDSRPERSGGIY